MFVDGVGWRVLYAKRKDKEKRWSLHDIVEGLFVAEWIRIWWDGAKDRSLKDTV